MLRKELLICLLLLLPLSQATRASDKNATAGTLINEIDGLLKKALDMRQKSPWHMNAEQLKACNDEAQPYRDRGNELRTVVRDTALPPAVRRTLVKAAENTVTCFACTSDDSSCYEAQSELKKARSTIN